MRHRHSLLACALLLAAAGAASANQVYSIFYDNRFGKIDDTTGKYTQIANLLVAQSYGIAYYHGTLYVEDSGNDLIQVDPLSGASTVIGSIGLSGVQSVVFAGGANGLFAIDESSALYSINAATGKGTMIGSTGLTANNGNWDTSLSSDGTDLYFTAGHGSSADELYKVNTTTGHATDLGSTGVRGIAGSAIVNGNLELYQYNWNQCETTYIYSATLGSTNFVHEAVLSVGIVDGGVVIPSGSGVTALNQIPEPTAFIQMALGTAVLGALVFCRRRAGHRIHE